MFSVAESNIYQGAVLFFLILVAAIPLSADVILSEDGENGTSAFVDNTNFDLDVLQDIRVAQGNYSFHMGHSITNFSDQSIELSQAFTPSDNTQLYWENRLSWATSSQIAVVEVQETGGFSWTEVWSQEGTSDAGDTQFTLQQVSLSDFAGMEIRLRFRFTFLGGSIFPSSAPQVGWVFDSIQVAGDFETREWYIGEPTGVEQLLLEYINRGRANSQADLQRFLTTTDRDILEAYSYFGVNMVTLNNQFSGSDFGTGAQSLGQTDAIPLTLPPLAPNYRLAEASRLHAEDMFLNQFQAHASSSDPIYPNQPNDQVAQRAGYQGYSYKTIAENISAYSKTPWESHAAFVVDWGTSGTTGLIYNGMQDPPGHRNNVYSDLYREVGIGVVEGTNGSVGPLLIAKAFGTEQSFDQPFLTGVVYHDIDGDGWYSDGEGVGGVSLTVEGAAYHSYTPASGGYAIPLNDDGEYVVTYELPDGTTGTESFTISSSENEKVDIQLGWSPSVISGKTGIESGGSGLYSQNTVSTATGYQWSYRSVEVWSQSYTAETSEPISVTPSSSHAASMNHPVDSSNPTYRLISHDAQDVYLEFTESFLATASSELVWTDLPLVISDTQLLDVQVSTDDGGSWQILDTRYGGGVEGSADLFSGEIHFSDFVDQETSEQRIPLADFAGQSVRFRFAIINPVGSSYFSSTFFFYGWYIDDITVTDAQLLGDKTTEDTDTNSWTFTPPYEGRYVLQAHVVNDSNVYSGGPMLEVATLTTAGSLLDANLLTSGWYESDWFGVFYQDNENWLYRNGLGWLHFGEDSGSGAWFYDDARLGWIWIESSLFPQFYRSSDGGWYNLAEADGVSQLYKFDDSTQSWVVVN